MFLKNDALLGFAPKYTEWTFWIDKLKVPK